MNDKDLQINTLQRQGLNLEEKVAQEGTELCKLQTAMARMEQEFKEKIEAEEARSRKLLDDFERERRIHETEIAKAHRVNESDRDGLQKDFEERLSAVKSEYRTCNDELRNLVEDKNREINRLKGLMEEERVKL